MQVQMQAKGDCKYNPCIDLKFEVELLQVTLIQLLSN